MSDKIDEYVTTESIEARVREVLAMRTFMSPGAIAAAQLDDSLASIFGVSAPNFRAVIEQIEDDLGDFLPKAPKPPHDTIGWLTSAAFEVRWKE